MRAHGRVGSMLSGGLDSSGVVAIASQHLQGAGLPSLPTFSAISQAPDCPETAAIGHMLNQFPLQPTCVAWENSDELIDAAIAGWTKHGEPFDASMTMLDCQYRNAARQGIRAVMDGIDANALLSDGDYLNHLAQSGQMRRVMYEARESARFFGARLSTWRCLRIALAGAGCK